MRRRGVVLSAIVAAAIALSWWAANNVYDTLSKTFSDITNARTSTTTPIEADSNSSKSISTPRKSLFDHFLTPEYLEKPEAEYAEWKATQQLISIESVIDCINKREDQPDLCTPEQYDKAATDLVEACQYFIDHQDILQ